MKDFFIYNFSVECPDFIWIWDLWNKVNGNEKLIART